MHALRRLALLLAFPLFTAALLAADKSATPTSPPAQKPGESQWVFSLLPKAFQKNPNLELTVITELTDAGKKLPPVSPAQPAYFIAQSSGYRALGDAPGNEQTLPADQIEKLLVRALATTGYRPAAPPAQAPTLVIFYTWGSHNLLVEGDEENPVLSGNLIARNLLDRAALVGGEKFAKEMLQLFQQADALAIAGRAPVAPDGEAVLGAAQLEFMNPVHQFKLRSPKNEALVDQAAADVYYVVASAYDHAALAKKQRVLLWRTRLTVAAQGVSQEQTLPTLIAAAGPWFGKEMAEPEVLTKRPIRDGHVEVGIPTVVEPAARPK